MLNKVRIGFAVSAVLLGVAHLIFGFIVFPQINPDVLWFLGAGIAMIVTGLGNFQSRSPFILRTQNALTFAYIAGLAYYLPQPQVLIGLFLFTGLFALSLRKTSG